MTTQRFQLLMVAALLLSGCYSRNNAQPPPPPEAFLATPIRRPVTETIEFTGATRASARVDLRAQVGGILEEIRFKDGATVNEGDVLFVIEQPPYQAKKQLADAGLLRAEATLKKSDLAVARAERIFKQNAGTESDLENAQAQKDTAAADVSAAKAEVANADLQLGYTTIKAPISGRISRHLVDRGNLVQAQTTELAVIESIDPIHVYFNVGERELLRLMEMVRKKTLPDPNMKPPKILMGLVTDAGFPYEGALDYREFGIDANTGTTLRRAEFENKDGLLIPGLFARVQAPLGEAVEQLLINETAVATDQKGEYVLLVGKVGDQENIVIKQYVDLGQTVDVSGMGPVKSDLQSATASGFAPVSPDDSVVRMRVVKAGLKDSDQVIVNGMQTARPGGTITPKPGMMGPKLGDGTNGEKPKGDGAASAPAAGGAPAKEVDGEKAPTAPEEKT
jgi:RND family efflux transporter MFP subunit